jgi:hypothetical protein
VAGDEYARKLRSQIGKIRGGKKQAQQEVGGLRYLGSLKGCVATLAGLADSLKDRE